MNDAGVSKARDWLGRVAGAERRDELVSDWERFSRRPLPVVTLFGAYDTGKSAIVRRLVVDAGLPVPEWVTISARHETFEAGQVELAGYVLQDTPGFSGREDDIRAANNTRAAMRAVGLSDVVCVVVNPQLPTGERDLLLQFVAQEWTSGSLIFLISRFDDAGANPLYDLEGYRNLERRKVAELRRSLSLSDDVPVHTVVPDFEQAAGPWPAPDRSVWDGSRHFDGMATLAKSLTEVGADDLQRLRSAAATRFWCSQVEAVLAEAGADLADLETAVRLARTQAQRRDLYLSQLEALDKAATLSLVGAVEEAIRSVLRRQVIDATAIGFAVDRELEAWWLRECSGLDRLLRDAGADFDQQRERPSWSVLADLTEPEQAAGGPGGGARTVTPTLEGILGEAVKALRAVRSLKGGGGTSARTAADSDGDAGARRAVPELPKIEIAEAALPVVLELVGLLEDFYGERQAAQARRERREQLQKDVTRIANNAAEQARAGWKPNVDFARAALHEIAGIDADELKVLEDQSARARDLVRDGRRIVAGESRS